MATRILKTVRSDGKGDYSTLNAAVVGQAQNLVTADSYLDIVINNDFSDTIGINITGYTTDETRYISISTNLAIRNTTAKWNSSKYILSYTTGTSWLGAIQINEEYVRIIGLQISIPYQASVNKVGINIKSVSVANKIYVEECMIKGTNMPVYNCQCIRAEDTDTNLYVKNTYVFDAGPASSSGGVVSFGNAYVSNCGIYNSTYGYAQITAGKTFTGKNCFVSSVTPGNGFVQLAGTLSLNYCSSSDATTDDFGGDGNIVNQTFTFNDISNFDFKLSDTDTGARLKGADLSNDTSYPITTDITGKTRNGKWDIGPYQNVSAKYVMMLKN